jgi:hypothetical protein
MMINTFPALLQSFFTDRLLRQLQASAHTVASYRDAFRLLLRFANEKLAKEPSVLSLKDLTPDFISSFLEYVEKGRNNCVRREHFEKVGQSNYIGSYKAGQFKHARL